MASLSDANGDPHGFPWEAGAKILAASRADLLAQKGLSLPTTFDELMNVCDQTKGMERVAPFTADKLHHWNWIPYLMGFGGTVFKDPPGNLTPTWDTPQAAEAADFYGRLLSEYGPPGVLSFTDDQAMQSQKTGRANMRTQAITWMVPLSKDPDSRVADKVRYGPVPAGPAGSSATCPGPATRGTPPPGSPRRAGFSNWPAPPSAARCGRRCGSLLALLPRSAIPVAHGSGRCAPHGGSLGPTEAAPGRSQPALWIWSNATG